MRPLPTCQPVLPFSSCFLSYTSLVSFLCSCLSVLFHLFFSGEISTTSWRTEASLLDMRQQVSDLYLTTSHWPLAQELSQDDRPCLYPREDFGPNIRVRHHHDSRGSGKRFLYLNREKRPAGAATDSYWSFGLPPFCSSRSRKRRARCLDCLYNTPLSSASELSLFASARGRITCKPSCTQHRVSAESSAESSADSATQSKPSPFSPHQSRSEISDSSEGDLRQQRLCPAERPTIERLVSCLNPSSAFSCSSSGGSLATDDHGRSCSAARGRTSASSSSSVSRQRCATADVSASLDNLLTTTTTTCNNRTSTSASRPVKVLVLGGDGFCGWATSLHLSARGYEVVIADNLSRRRIDEDLGTSSLTPIATIEERVDVWNRISQRRASRQAKETLDVASASSVSSKRAGEGTPVKSEHRPAEAQGRMTETKVVWEGEADDLLRAEHEAGRERARSTAERDGPKADDGIRRGSENSATTTRQNHEPREKVGRVIGMKAHSLHVDSQPTTVSGGEKKSCCGVQSSALRFVHLDIAQDFPRLVRLLLTERPDAVIHFAEQRAAPYSMKSSDTRRYTVDNNISATHNVLCALVQATRTINDMASQTSKESSRDGPTSSSSSSSSSSGRHDHPHVIHLIHLGTMGVYGYGGGHGGANKQKDNSGRGKDLPPEIIPEGYLSVTLRSGRQTQILHPAHPGSVYHMTKCMDALMFQYYAKNYGLSITDLHQGIVWGTATTETKMHEKLINRFDYDSDYGTVLNRFLMQSALGLPLTVYGSGGQTRAFIHIQDTCRCIGLALQNCLQTEGRRRGGGNGTDKRSVLILNQVAETLRLGDLAKLIQTLTKAEVVFLPNPREEANENSLLVSNTKFKQLGWSPVLLRENLLHEVRQVAEKYRHRCNPKFILPSSFWNEKRAKSYEDAHVSDSYLLARSLPDCLSDCSSSKGGH